MRKLVDGGFFQPLRHCAYAEAAASARANADWKQSSARGGARTALTLAKAHYPEMDLDQLTSGIPESGEDGAPVDEAAIRQSVLGYDQLCALGTPLNVYYEAYELPGSPSQASASASAATAGGDGGDEVSSKVPPSS
jgi:hypothetical protein